MRRNISEPGRGGTIQHDWTKGNLFRNLLMLSWPMTVTQLMMSLGPTIDTIWVGKLGEAAVAAVGVSGTVVQLAQGVMMGFSTGMMALITRAIGAGDIKTANKVAQQAFVVSALYAIIIALVGQFLGERILRIITNDPEIVSLGTTYLRIEFIGGATMVFRMMMDVIMQASGDTRNPMWISAIYRGFHIVLCPFLIFGWWIFPRMGVSGAALTGVIAQLLGVILGIRILVGHGTRVKLSFKGFHFDPAIIWRIVRIGFPASISGIQRTLSQFVLQVFIAPFGTVALAAHTIAQRIEMFILMPAMSFGQGAGILVGQNLGAKEPKRAEKSAWLAVAIIEAFILIVAALVLIFTKPIIHIFNNDPVLLATGTQFIHIAIVAWLFIGFMFVIMSCLQSAGDTLPTMIISVTTTWLITILLSYLLSKYTGAGIIGIRWAMSASVVVTAFANVIYFRTGRWKTRRV
jgi:putative MATE family efflux protein